MHTPTYAHINKKNRNLKAVIFYECSKLMSWCDVSVCEYHEMLKLLHPSNICQCFMENLLNLSSSFLRHRGDCCLLVSLLCTSSAGMLAALVTAPSGQLFHTSPRFLDFDNRLLTFNFQEMDIFRFHSRWVLVFRAYSTQGPLSVCLVPSDRISLSFTPPELPVDYLYHTFTKPSIPW